MIAMTELGEFIKLRRMELGMSVHDVGRRASLSGAYISRLERGETTNPTVLSLEAIAGALRVKYETLSDIVRSVELSQDRLDDDLRRQRIVNMYEQLPQDKQHLAIALLRALVQEDGQSE